MQHEDILSMINNIKEFRGISYKYPEFYNAVIEHTNFLSKKAYFKQRLWHLVNYTQNIPKCKVCSKDVRWDKDEEEYRTYCSSKCSNLDEDLMIKRKQTNIERYGVDCVFKNKDVYERIRNTNLKRYKVENPAQNKEIQKKIYDTNLKKYGVKCVFQNKKIQERIKDTLHKKYGVSHNWEAGILRDKTKEKLILKRGVRSYTQLHNIPAFVLISDFKWLYDQYVNELKSSKQIAQEIGIDKKTVCRYLVEYNIPFHRIKKFSIKALHWLDYIASKEDIFIQHGGNIGEYEIPETNYFADGYCVETNTIYEFHGDAWHGNLEIYEEDEQCHPFDPDVTAGELYEKTINRENNIRELGYNLVVIWEKQWNSAML